MSLVQEVYRVSAGLLDGRQKFQVLGHLVSEVGELAEEVVIDQGLSHKSKGVDGIVGESIDVIICALDMIFQTDPSLTEEDLVDYAIKKLDKWRLSVEARS